MRWQLLYWNHEKVREALQRGEYTDLSRVKTGCGCRARSVPYQPVGSWWVPSALPPLTFPAMVARENVPRWG